MPDNQLLQLLTSYVRAPLSHKLLESITNCDTVDQFHRKVIKTFIPSTIYEQFKQSYVCRGQGENEMFPHYISDVRQYSEILKVSMSELEIVEAILVGLCPAERSRLVLMSRPTNFWELKQLCVHSSNIYYADQLRLDPCRQPPPDSRSSSSNSSPQRMPCRNQRYPPRMNEGRCV